MGMKVLLMPQFVCQPTWFLIPFASCTNKIWCNLILRDITPEFDAELVFFYDLMTTITSENQAYAWPIRV